MNKTIPVILGGAIILILTSCDKKQIDQNSSANYPVKVLDTTDQTLTTTYAATITGCQTVEIRPQVEGMLTSICIREGAPVRKGQILFEIEPAQFQAAYDIALANVHSAEAAVSTANSIPLKMSWLKRMQNSDLPMRNLIKPLPTCLIHRLNLL